MHAWGEGWRTQTGCADETIFHFAFILSDQLRPLAAESSSSP